MHLSYALGRLPAHAIAIVASITTITIVPTSASSRRPAAGDRRSGTDPVQRRVRPIAPCRSVRRPRLPPDQGGRTRDHDQRNDERDERFHGCIIDHRGPILQGRQTPNQVLASTMRLWAVDCPAPRTDRPCLATEAVAVGFEPTRRLRAHTLSRRAPSSARAGHRVECTEAPSAPFSSPTRSGGRRTTRTRRRRFQ
jgi:hypothetical protein